MSGFDGAIIEVSLLEMGAMLSSGAVTSVALTESCLARIRDVDPTLCSVIAVNPRALETAREADARRGRDRAHGPLDGVPILIKDNIDVAGLATTAGSLALRDNIAAQDAPVVKRLIDAGAVVLAKTNMSEWANIRASRSVNGWSAVGGLTRNPYALDRSASGSSSGSAVAVAASLAPAALGTETDGSIVWPAAVTGIVGLKPTVGLLSRDGIIPISHTQDTPGPLARSVAEVATVLDAITERGGGGYVQNLDAGSLNGARLGVMRFLSDFDPLTWALFDAALDVMRGEGATIVDIDAFDMTPILNSRINVLLTEFKVGVNAYLSRCNPAVKARTLADVIAFNNAEPRELMYFGQDFLEAAEATTGLSDSAYAQNVYAACSTARAHGIDRMIEDHGLSALIAPTSDPAWRTDLDHGDQPGGSASSLPATAGYPHLTVPMGQIAGLPVGISFIGPAWSEHRLLSLGFAFEQSMKGRKPPCYRAGADAAA